MVFASVALTVGGTLEPWQAKRLHEASQKHGDFQQDSVFVYVERGEKVYLKYASPCERMLERAAAASPSGRLVLHCDSAPWGELESVEQFLKLYRIAYSLRADDDSLPPFKVRPD